MAETAIEWCDRVWNCVRGCRRVSPGCEHCYAERQAHRFSGMHQPYEGLTKLTSHGPAWTGQARFVAAMLGDPLGWRKPQRIFVNSMSDLFHEDITNDQIAAVFGVMAACPQHSFQVLTKRPERMLEWFDWLHEQTTGPDFARDYVAPLERAVESIGIPVRDALEDADTWPLPNVWLGVSCENQDAANGRIPLLLQTPAAVRWVSAEPLLGPINFHALQIPDEREGLRFSGLQRQHDDRFGRSDIVLDWIVTGGESGPGARPCDLAWIQSIVVQCAAAGTACFVKQLGTRPYDSDYRVGIYAPEDRRTPTRPDGAGGRMAMGNLVLLRDHKGGDPSEWPSDLRVRQWPEVHHG